MKDKLISVREASTILGCHDDTVRKLIHQEVFAAARLLHKFWLWESDVRRYLKTKEPKRTRP